MPEFFGICGRFNPRPCNLAWASTYPNKIGVYPANLLPSTRTTWYAASDGTYDFSPPIVDPGETFGLTGASGVILGGLTQSGTFSVQFDTFLPQSHVIIIFARTANRLNAAHIITAEEADSLDEAGNIIINAGEFVFEVVAVTDAPAIINNELTEQEIEDIKGKEEESDRVFRKLFQLVIPGNRFINIETNKRGIEYRLDNGGSKANAALDLAGSGDLQNTTGYRDASSKLIRIKADRRTAEGATIAGETLRAGDVIYLSFVAVKEHYTRQSINMRWSIIAISLPPQCFGAPITIKVAHFRFYEWPIAPVSTEQAPRLAGWRAVETFGVPTNFTAALSDLGGSASVIGQIGETISLGDFGSGNPGNLSTFSFLPTNPIVTLAQLDAFIQDRATLPQYAINFNQRVGSVSHHLNIGVGGNTTVFRDADWFRRQQFQTYKLFEKAAAHVYMNTHPKALQKRDVDKFGIEASLAQQIEQDIKSGKITSFPFMDDPDIQSPATEPTGAMVSVSSSNTKFEPFQPVTRWTIANGEVECAVQGAVILGNFSGGRGDVIAIFGIASNIMTERFEKDTRMLVERHFTFGQIGPRTVAIQGAPGAAGAVSCVAGHSWCGSSFTCHIDDDNFILLNEFNNEFVSEGMRKLEYRPDLEPPPIADNDDPTPSQFESLLGISAMLGDAPGFKPGRVLSASQYAALSSFQYKAKSEKLLEKFRSELTDDQIITITETTETGKITIPVSTGFHGSIELQYRLPGDEPIKAAMLFKAGSSLQGVVDSITIPVSTETRNLRIDHHWMKGDTIEIVGEGIEEMQIEDFLITQLQDSVANDFLTEGTSAERPDFDNLVFLENKSLLFETDIVSMAQDSKSSLFIFFNDSDDGISCIQSHDNADTWYYHYGIIEQINGNAARNPMVVHAYDQNACYLFFQFLGKIMCKKVPFSMFKFIDSFIIEKFEERLTPGGSESSPPTQAVSKFTRTGEALRRDLLSFPAAGDLTDEVFLETAGKDTTTNIFEPFEERFVEDGTTSTPDLKKVRKQPVAIGKLSAFTNRNVEDINFSAYRTKPGTMQLFFMGQTEDSAGGGNQLQCHFSTDDGQSWYSLWESIENGRRRLRVDIENESNFVDRSATDESDQELEGTNPLETSQNYQFGVNVHWSRLKRHKKEGGETIDSESEVLGVDAPYAFYHPNSSKVFLFYIYSECLLCKIFDDALFSIAAHRRELASDSDKLLTGMVAVKKVIERGLLAHFVDGNLETADIREEIQGFINTETNEIMAGGNIVFNHQFGIDAFKDRRTISSQRVCAYDLPNGNIRVFYKHDGSNDLRSALWNGRNFYVEDLMKNTSSEPVNLEQIVSDPTDVTGGFGGTGFTGSSGAGAGTAGAGTGTGTGTGSGSGTGAGGGAGDIGGGGG